MPEWQPIETAPKDKRVLELLPKSGVASGEWNSFGNDWWCGMCGGYECDSAFDDEQPTHWMPLPSPPAQSSAVEEVENA